MRKQEFLCTLKKRLSGLPNQDVEERLNFYSEMIDDRMEEGCSEEEAVLNMGSIDEIVTQIIADIPFTKIAKERLKPKRQLKAWEVVLLVLGSPLWVALAIAGFAVIFSLYAVLWAVLFAAWAVFVSLVCSVPVGLVEGLIFMGQGNGPTGFAMIGISLVCAGLAIFMYFGCKAITKAIILLTKKFALGIKKCFVKAEESIE